MVIAVDNHYQLRVQVPLTIFACPSASYHAISHLCITLMTIVLIPLEHFHTKTPSVKVSDNCGFRYPFHKLSLYSQPFESTSSFLT
jgi:hypothetical protein